MIIPAQTELRNPVEFPPLEQFLAEMHPGWRLSPLSGGDIYRVERSFVSQAERIAALVGERALDAEIDASTDHAWLVVMGQLAQALGLVKDLEAVPIDQKQGPKCPPQTKLIELLVGILGGIEYLQDLNLEAHPIVKDATIAQAWGQAIFAHYSGVSRTLEAADEGTLAAVIEVLRQVSQPFIQEAVMETIRKQGCLTADVDLTGREVSPTSTDYDDATFGWMADDVHKGYQAAILSLVCERWQRLLLALQRYTGRTPTRRNAFRPWYESWNRSWACARTGELRWYRHSVRPCRPASGRRKTTWSTISARNRPSEPSSAKAGRKPSRSKPKSCAWKTSTRPKNGQRNPILNWPSCVINWLRPRNGNCEPGAL